MAVNLPDFTNDRYKILKTLYDRFDAQLGYISLSQQELAQLTDFSKPKAHQIMKFLTEKGYVSAYQGFKGKYILTPSGHEVIRLFEEHKTTAE